MGMIRSGGCVSVNGSIDMVEEGEAIQRGRDRLGSWVHINVAKFSKAKCKVVHLVQGNPKDEYRLSEEWIESRRTLESLLKNSMKANSVSPECQMYAGLHQKKQDQ